MRRRTIESAMVNAARERATDAAAAAAARTAERDELDSQRSSGPSDERIKTERRNPAAAFLRRRARSGAPPCIITPLLTPRGDRDVCFATYGDAGKRDTRENGTFSRGAWRTAHNTRGEDLTD